MKKYVIISLSLLYCIWSFPKILASPYNLPIRTLEIPFADSISIDGNPDEFYSEMQNTIAFNITGSMGNDDDFTASFQVCYNLERLYILATVLDNYPNMMPYTTSYYPWFWDNMEVCIDLDTTNSAPEYDTNTIFLIFNPGIQDSATWPGRAEQNEFAGNVYSEIRPDGWVLEVGIPWTAVLDTAQLPEDLESYLSAVHGFDVMFGDSDTDGPDLRDCQTAWDEDNPGMPDATEDLAWNNRTVFGIMTLSPDGYNNLPHANAGYDQFVYENSLVTLDGTNSHEPEGDPYIYTWEAPDGIVLSDIHSVTPTFTAPHISIDKSYIFSLVIDNGTYESNRDFVTINVLTYNIPPFSDAGPDQTVLENTLVTLDGSNSSDLNHDPITFTWRTRSSNIMLSDIHAISPTFETPEVSELTNYYITLKVSDGFLFDENSVVITVIEEITSIPETDKNQSIILSPNPTNHLMSITSDELIYNITIINIYGEVIWKQAVNAKDIQVDLEGCSPGNYFIMMITETGEVTKQFTFE